MKNKIKRLLNPKKKSTKDMNRHFSTKDTQIVNRHMKRWVTSLVIREMQIKTTGRYHFTCIRVVIIKNTGNNYVKQYNPCALLVRMQNGAATVENRLAVFQKLKQNYHMIQQFYWVGQKVCLFPNNGSSSAWLSLTSFKTIFLDCIGTAVISACI